MCLDEIVKKIILIAILDCTQLRHSSVIIFASLHFQRVERIVKSHDRTQPMFLYMAFQNVHSPVQAPQKYVDKYKFIKDDVRRTYAGMVDILDEAVGNLTRIFQEHG